MRQRTKELLTTSVFGSSIHGEAAGPARVEAVVRTSESGPELWDAALGKIGESQDYNFHVILPLSLSITNL
jgi:hypothetical protein